MIYFIARDFNPLKREVAPILSNPTGFKNLSGLEYGCRVSCGDFSFLEMTKMTIMTAKDGLQSLEAQRNPNIVISTEGRNHNRKSTKIGDILCRVSRVISRSSK